jgi:hypothetical protein
VKRALVLALLALVAAALVPAPAAASPGIRYGIHDDAWIAYGPGTLAQRLTKLDRLGVDVVRYTLDWNRIAAQEPAKARDHADGAYDWALSDSVLKGLRARGISALVGIVGTPRWANGGSGPNVAPTSGKDVADFAYAAAKRYRWVRDWLIWNEPNQRRWLLPANPIVYTTKILNPAYAAIHSANRRARVGGGVTAPRGNTGGTSPVFWIRGMRAAGAKLDAYAHHPYPLDPRRDTPFSAPCAHCETITMSSLERLEREVRRAFPRKRIWLTEFGYQTNPPDRLAGVAPSRAAEMVGQAALRALRSPLVDLLVHFLVQDEPALERWQSGLQTTTGRAKPAKAAFMVPLAQVPRRASVWGQVRPRGGPQPYRLQVLESGRWRWLGGTGRTTGRGSFTRAVPRGSVVRAWSPRDRVYSAAVRVL